MIIDDQLAAEGDEKFGLSLRVISETEIGEFEFEIVIPVDKITVTIQDNDGKIWHAV